MKRCVQLVWRKWNVWCRLERWDLDGLAGAGILAAGVAFFWFLAA